MFQESALFPWLNTVGNVMFGLKLVRGLTKFERANLHELSGGMRQVSFVLDRPAAAHRPHQHDRSHCSR
jgi:ABC-type taurine transport system ATPase subunit